VNASLQSELIARLAGVDGPDMAVEVCPDGFPDRTPNALRSAHDAKPPPGGCASAGIEAVDNPATTEQERRSVPKTIACHEQTCSA
jgi:hypothetical protein